MQLNTPVVTRYLYIYTPKPVDIDLPQTSDVANDGNESTTPSSSPSGHTQAPPAERPAKRYHRVRLRVDTSARYG